MFHKINFFKINAIKHHKYWKVWNLEHFHWKMVQSNTPLRYTDVLILSWIGFLFFYVSYFFSNIIFYFFWWICFRRGLYKQRYKHLTKQGLNRWDTTVHGWDSEHLCIWVCPFKDTLPLWLVCFCKNGEPKNLQEAILWWLLSQWRKATEDQSANYIHLL